MHGVNTIEFIYIVSSIMSACAILMCVIQHTLDNLDQELIKLKNNKKELEKKIEELERREKEKASSRKKQNSISNFPIQEAEINEILVNENRKLHVRCDMLEEELNKTRENKDKHVTIQF